MVPCGQAAVELDPATFESHQRPPTSEFQPQSKDGPEDAPENLYADWKMHADYVLPSTAGLILEQGAVFWPEWTDQLYPLVGPGVKSSDHRLVYLDLSTESATTQFESPIGDNGGSGALSIPMLLSVALAFGLFGRTRRPATT